MAVVANVAINVDAANAIRQLKTVDQAASGLNKGFAAASAGAKGLGAAIQSALGPLLAVTTAVAAVQKGLETTFARGAAEQRLRNLTESTGEYEAALAVAASSADKFGMSQTETTKALADVFGRLKGVGFGLKETSEIYEGFNVIAKQSGLTAADAAGTFFQLSQALGKGKLNGDEFVTVSERMPQLLDAIATATGKTRGELSAMAQNGQITSEVLYKALSTSADAADNLNGKLTEQQRAFNALSQIGDRLSNILGQVFAPVVVKGAELLAAAGQRLSEWYEYVGAVVFPRLAQAVQPVIVALKNAFEGVNFDLIRVVVQNILIKGFEVATGVIGKLSSVLAFVVDRFKELSSNPVFRFIADQVGRLVNSLGLTNDKVSQLSQEQNQVKAAAAETVKQYSSLPKPIDDSKEAAKQLKEEQQAVTKAIQDTTASITASGAVSAAVGEQRFKIESAYLNTQKEITNVLMSQAENQLRAAKTQEQKIAAARDIYNLTVRQARLEYRSNLASIRAESEKAKLAVDIARQKVKQVEAVVLLAKAEGSVNDAHYKALQATRDAVELAEIQARTVAEVAYYQEQGAKAALDGKIQAAEAAFQNNILAKNTNNAATAASAFAGNMRAGANAAMDAVLAAGSLERIAANIRTLGATSTQTLIYTDEEMRKLGIGKYANAGTRSRAYAAAAASDQIIDGSREGVSAASNLSAGSSSIAPNDVTLNIQTGPVMQQDGQRYVTIADMEDALQNLAATLLGNGRTAGGRRYAGVR